MSLTKMKQKWAAQRQRQERQLFEVIDIPYDGLKLRMEVTSDSDDHDMHFD